jgi:hypothetical protein
VKCKATTKSGEPCMAMARKDGFCALHGDPNRAASLGRKSGQSRRHAVTPGENNFELTPPRTAKDIRNSLGDVMSAVVSGRLDPKIATTIGYLATVLMNSIERSDTEDRIAALEAELLDVQRRQSVQPGGLQ